MAYQNVGTPIFYINLLEWLAAIGVISLPQDQGSQNRIATEFLTLPVDPVPSYSWDFKVLNPNGTSGMGWTENGFVALLGHQLKSEGGDKLVVYNQGVPLYNQITPVVNCDTNGVPDYDGYSIFTTTEFINGVDQLWVTQDNVNTFGSIIIGTYYDMPNAPNLSLTMSREYGGTKEFTTYNGNSMSNTMWSKPPSWGNLGAWELWKEDQTTGECYGYDADGDYFAIDAFENGDPVNSAETCGERVEELYANGWMGEGYTWEWDPQIETEYIQALSRSGRRVWDLKFSYMDDGDLWGPNQMTAPWMMTTTGYNYELTGMEPSGTELLNNPSFEDGFNSGVAINWVAITPTQTFTEETDIVKSGSAQKIEVTSAGSLAYLGIKQTLSSLEGGESYRATGWVYTSNGNQVEIEFGGQSTSFNTEEEAWTHLSVDLVLSDAITSTEFRIYQEPLDHAPEDYLIIDDLSLQKLIAATPIFLDNLLTHQNFFSQVWHKTAGGTLPFIFQPDNNNINEWAIAKFKDSTLKAEQTAFNVYDISVSIEEVW